ncbi:MAG: hypothetical protein ACTHX2_10930 [Microbacterium sp.]
MSLAIERDSSPPDPAAVYLFIELELDPDRSLSPSVDADGSLHVGVTELQPGSTDDASTGRGDRDGRAEEGELLERERPQRAVGGGIAQLSFLAPDLA